MQPYQERVVAEKEELDARIEKLRYFLGAEAIGALGAEEHGRLIRQERIMTAYSEILGQRIAAFE